MRTKRSSMPRDANTPLGPAIRYRDLVVTARRDTSRNVVVQIEESPTGGTSPRVSVRFSESEVNDIRSAFSGKVVGGDSGRMHITQSEATELGKRLTKVLFPPALFPHLARSLGDGLRRGGGVRIRLALDESLIDLPWEYVYRPDRLDHTGLSGFLLLDPSISLVRLPADSRLKLPTITGRERLAFVGTFWRDGKDVWEVKSEFDRLRAALEPVASYITPTFAAATDDDAFAVVSRRSPAIFHYAGHIDFENESRAFMVREVGTGSAETMAKIYVDDFAENLTGSAVRLCVMTACNSGFWPAVEPLVRAGIPAVVAINGIISSQSTIEFCVKLYESLAVGLSLDEAIGRARVHVMQWGAEHRLFDWGLYMTYMPSPQAVIFPRARTSAVTKKQKDVRLQHRAAVGVALNRARSLDGSNFGEIMSELTKHRVLILGRFTKRRLKVLEAIQEELAHHPNGYIPELFTFRRPEGRDLVESIIGFAALSRFIIADLSEPKSVQSELEAVAPSFQSVPIVPLINQSGREYATFSSIRRRQNVVKPTVRYRDIDDLRQKIDSSIIPSAETKLNEVRPEPDAPSRLRRQVDVIQSTTKKKGKD